MIHLKNKSGKITRWFLRFFAGILLVFMFLPVNIDRVSAQPQGVALQDTVFLSIADTLAAAAGDTVSVAVILDRGSNDVAALGAALKATNNLLSYIDFTQGPIIPGPIFNVNAPAPDSVRFGFFNAGSGNITQNGLLVTLRFQIDPAAAEGDSSLLIFNDLSGSDPNFNSLIVRGISGKVTVISNAPPQLDPIADQSMDEGTLLDVPVSATDINGDNITLTVNNLPSFGSFTDYGDGTGNIHFAPGFDDAGTYPNIEVIATDDGTPNLSDTTSFTLTVIDYNRPPEAVDDSVGTAEDSAITIHVLANDSDPDNHPLTIITVTQPDSGMAAIDPGDTTVTYTPNPDYYGDDFFDYVVSDGHGGTDTAQVIVSIIPVNDPPTLSGLPDSIIIDADTSATLDIWSAANDIETSDDLLTYDFLSIPDTLILNYDLATGILTVSAQDTLNGVDADLTITVSDPEGAVVSDTVSVIVMPVVGIGGALFSDIPQSYILKQNYPNPFNPTTQIRFGLPKAGKVKVEVFNILGQRVTVLLEEKKLAGYHQVQFDARDLTSGIYFYRLQAADFQVVKKMMLLR